MNCTVLRKGLFSTLYCCLLTLIIIGFDACTLPDDEDPTQDGSKWENVVEPAGFGSTDNYAVVAMAAYKDHLYAMVRNETDGVEMWRTDGTAWEQVLFPNGETNGIYGNHWLNCLWGSMMVFKDKLYCGFSSGYQGTYLISTGCEIWRYDGSTWEPVISDKKDTEESGAITGIADCEKRDDDVTARITDSTKQWTENQWAGGVLQITSGSGRFRRFTIVGNTADTLTIQQNEVAGNIGEEDTICAGQKFNNPFPAYEYEVGSVEIGDSYEIGTGSDENGFGNFWNKMLPEMTIFNDQLYVSTGLNYDYGAQVWYTDNGDTWQVTQPANSFGNYHTDDGYPDSRKPISTSIPSLCVSAVSGEPVLYAGGTGSSGDQGSCSRVARLTDNGWELIVDRNVDDNDEGTNESGFGGGTNCSMWNGDFMPWSLADFTNGLNVGIQSLAGTRVLYTPTGSSEDGSWAHSVGDDAAVPNGFDGRRNCGNPIIYQNIASNLFVFNKTLYAGTVTLYSPPLGATDRFLTGAQLWKTTDGTTWQPVTLNGFGDTHITSIECFAEFNGTLYVGVNKGSVDGPEGLNPHEGCKIFKLVSAPVAPQPQFEDTAVYQTEIPHPHDDNQTQLDPTDIYYPAPADLDNGTYKFPIALFLQGGRCDKPYYSLFAQHVASYGFIVVVPNHTNTYSLIPGTTTTGLFSEQVQMYDTLDFMAAENENPESPLAGHIDTETLVMLGHSYGAAATIGAIQNQCEFPLCESGTFTRPEQLKAVALCGINTQPYGKPLDYAIRYTENMGLPMAIVNGKLDSHALYNVTKISYARIADPPKMLVHIEGANHYAISTVNNPPGPDGERGPGPDTNEPTIPQEVSNEIAARWCALFLRAHALGDQEALEYVSSTGKYLDPNVEVCYEPAE